MTSNGFDNGDSPVDRGFTGPADSQRISEIARHVTVALSRHVRRLHQDALPVPGEVEELAAFLMRLTRSRQDASMPPAEHGIIPQIRRQDRLLVTKGEVAQRLGVSVRTVERLVATGRLPQVHVERLARVRVQDLEAYVNGLGDATRHISRG